MMDYRDIVEVDEYSSYRTYINTLESVYRADGGHEKKTLPKFNKMKDRQFSNGYSTDASGAVVYKFNDFGYRSNFDYQPFLGTEKECNICIGDSLTEGVGLEVEDTWPFLLSKMTNIPSLNLGVNGFGFGYCTWILNYLIRAREVELSQKDFRKLNFKNVYILIPSVGRKFYFFDDHIGSRQHWSGTPVPKKEEKNRKWRGMRYEIESELLQYEIVNLIYHQRFILDQVIQNNGFKSLVWDEYPVCPEGAAGIEHTFSKAADNVHPGKDYQLHVANEFYKL
jgi:hypothetical protein